MSVIHQQRRAIRADPATVRRLLTDVANWPALFPHITSVDQVWQEAGLNVFRIRARWHHLPISWMMQQRASADIVHRIHGGIAAGTEIVWQIDGHDDFAQVTTTSTTSKRLLTLCIKELVRQTLDMVQILAQAEQRGRHIAAA